MRMNVIDRWSTDRAVSPVIGVILMVAITVILAAVIGAFVLEIGDQQETAPNASFETEEELKSAWDPSRVPHINDPQVAITLAGGDTLDISSTRFHLDGANSTWGLRNGKVTPVGDNNNRRIFVQPTPNVCETFGTNDKATITSGQTEYVLYGASGKENGNLEDPGYGIMFPHNNVSNTNICSQFKGMRRTGSKQRIFSSSTVEGTNWASNRDVNRAFTHVTVEGSTVSVVWTASSGGKTQQLFSYEVQQSARDFS